MLVEIELGILTVAQSKGEVKNEREVWTWTLCRNKHKRFVAGSEEEGINVQKLYRKKINLSPSIGIA